MKVVQMTLDEELIAIVDKIVKSLKTTRSAFTRSALKQAVESLKIQDLERQHKEAYKKKPIKSNEFSVWGNEQVWPE